MTPDKQELVEQFVSGCQELGLSAEESVDLAARNLIGAVSVSGQNYAQIEVEGVGIVEVDCQAKVRKVVNRVALVILAVGFTALGYFAFALFEESTRYGIL
ncbi:hypothetical protein L1D14_04150 [Vibrio tubiashii]|uniref:hypothetical protein n=1 Tax=Vibrio tubiashii TaxID=29498 RepID=UPI001EFD272B|nr:hypothetical protein [Vibrio tubiashii]MCG9575423.1 hypothetical protein [Vibrio tubiashii]